MTDTLVPAEAFPPGEYLREELAERGWAEGEFAEIIGRPVQAVSEIVNGKKDITPETAVAIGAALGTSAEFWLNLQAAYRLHQVRASQTPKVRPVERRALLRSLVPVRELQKRGWLPGTSDVDELEAAVCGLLRIDEIGESPGLSPQSKPIDAQQWFAEQSAAGADRLLSPGTWVAWDAGGASLAAC